MNDLHLSVSALPLPCPNSDKISHRLRGMPPCRRIYSQAFQWLLQEMLEKSRREMVEKRKIPGTRQLYPGEKHIQIFSFDNLIIVGPAEFASANFALDLTRTIPYMALRGMMIAFVANTVLHEICVVHGPGAP